MRSVFVITATTISSIVLVGFLMVRQESTVSEEEVVPSKLSHRASPQTLGNRVGTLQNSIGFDDEKEVDPPFWNDALVPDPVRPRLPRPAAIPRLPDPSKDGPSLAQVRADVTSAEPGELNQSDLTEFNSALVAWHQLAPDEAIDWIDSRDSLAGLDGAIQQIAYLYSSQNEHLTAAAWAKLLQDKNTHDTTLRDVLGVGHANRGLNAPFINNSGLPPALIDEVYNYTAVD